MKTPPSSPAAAIDIGLRPIHLAVGERNRERVLVRELLRALPRVGGDSVMVASEKNGSVAEQVMEYYHGRN